MIKTDPIKQQAYYMRLKHIEPEVFNYDNVDYNQFWQSADRSYEDAAERLALRRLTADISGSCLEIGGGYGRLVNEYAPRCTYVLLTDCTEKMIEQAKANVDKLGLNNVKCRTANLYHLEEYGNTFDNAVCVRVMHHVEEVPAFFRQVNAALNDGGVFIFEYANKKNLLEICRWLLRRPNIAPFAYLPTRRGAGIFYNFHPRYIQDTLKAHGFIIEQELAVSIFRNKFLKKLCGTRLLIRLERLLQKPLAHLHPSPSVFVKARKISPCPSENTKPE